MWLSNLSEGEMQSMSFQTLFSIFGRRFMRLSPLEGTIVSLDNKPDKKKNTGVPAGSIYGHIEAGCVFVGMEEGRRKYKIVPRFRSPKAPVSTL